MLLKVQHYVDNIDMLNCYEPKGYADLENDAPEY